MIFIDTGAFVARYLPRDQHHDAATDGWRRLSRGRQRCVTTSFVLDEAITLLARRTDATFAAERARAMLTSERLTVVRPTAESELAAVELLEKFKDKALSFTDCVSFVTMRSHAIERVFGFDRHFRDGGFTLWPGKSRRRR